MLSTFSHSLCQHYPLPAIQFSAINLCSCGIKLITPIPPKLLFISQLYLDNNLLQSLIGIEQFMNLQILSVNFNFISQIEQLLRITNKFLIRELSVIGNPIESSVNKGGKWLREEGFYNVVVVNDVGAVGRVRVARRCFVVNGSSSNQRMDTNSDNNNYSFQQSPYHNPSSSAHHNNKQISQSQRRYHHHQQQQSMIAMEDNRSQASNERSSRVVYLTKREAMLDSSRRVKEYESTGDTRRQRLSSFRVENSPGVAVGGMSPNFNYSRHNYQDHHYQYRNSLPNRKITQFNLYPVDQEMTRSRHIQEDATIYHNDSNNSFSKIKPLNHTIQYNRRVNPFKQSPQLQYNIKRRSNSFTTATGQYPAYRSQRYQLNDVNTQYRNWMDQCQQEEEEGETSQEQGSAFQLIEREIPIYKQAIGIAFYYRNLLEKVFGGLKSATTLKQGIVNTQKSSQINSDEFEKARFVTEQQQQHQPQQQQTQLLRYAWMKIQLYSNYRKIMHKYHLSSSSGKKHNSNR